MRPDTTIQWKAYPALLLAGCLAVGIGAAAWWPHLPFWFWVGAATPGVGAALVMRRVTRHRLVSATPLVTTGAVAVAVVCLGGSRHAFQQAVPRDHIAHRLQTSLPEDTPVSVAGYLLEHPVDRAFGTRTVLAAERIIIHQDTMATTGCLQVTLSPSYRQRDASFPALARGDEVQLRGRLRRPPRRRNPADFDVARYWRQRGIYGAMTVRDTADVVLLGRRLGGMDRLVVPMQAYVRRQISRLLPSADSRAVLHALILGDRSRLEADTRDQFARTGLMHLLAVSGLHVLLVGMVLYGLLRPILLRLRLRWKAMEITRAAITMTLLVLYMLLAGSSASVVRAVVMTGLFIGGTVLQRSSHLLNTLGVAAVVMLVARPTHLFEAGFQLSFAAVAAIVTLHPLLTSALPEAWMSRPLRRHLITTTTVSLAATLGTMPVLLYHFGQASFAGLVLNLPAIPLTTLTLASGLVALSLAGWFPLGASVFGSATDVLARGLLATAAAGDTTLGWATVQVYVDDTWNLLAMTAALFMLAQWPRPRLRWRLGATTLCFTAIGLWIGVMTGAHTPRLDVVFFDVGHGDAALVTLPNGRHLLIDAGGRDDFSDQGTRTVLPHLERFGIRRLDAVLVTHPHSDHLGGLPSLLRSLPVRRVLHNGQTYASRLYDETAHLLDSLGIAHRAISAGDTLALDPSVRLQVLAPESVDATTDANDASVVLRLVYGHTTFLFTGDAEAASEQRIHTRYGALLPSDVVKVGHHGSQTSSTPAFVHHIVPDTTRSTRAVVSVGSASRFGLPDEEVLLRWHTHGATVWTTARRGALWLRSNGRRVRQIDWR